MEGNSAETICEAIFMLIPEVPRLAELFQSWCLLDADERALLDRQARASFHPEGSCLYVPLTEALRRWEFIQDTQGAPGCEPGLVSFSGHQQLEEEILNAICALQQQIEELNEQKKKEKTEIETKKLTEVADQAVPILRMPASRNGSPVACHILATGRQSRSSDDLPSCNKE